MTVGVLGAGPHGQAVARLLAAMPASGTVCLFDDALAGYAPCARWEGAYVAGAVWPAIRRRIACRAAGKPLGRGVVVFPGVFVDGDAVLGDHAHLLANSVVSHGCVVGDFVTVCGGAVLAGECQVGDGVFVGANATVIHGGIVIGDGATVGAGAVVLDDVAPGVVVAGNPARVVSRTGERERPYRWEP